MTLASLIYDLNLNKEIHFINYLRFILTFSLSRFSKLNSENNDFLGRIVFRRLIGFAFLINF